MTDVNSVLFSLLLLAGLALASTLIYVLYRLSQTLRVLEHEVTTLTRTVAPLLEKAESLTEQADATLRMFQEHREALAVSVEYIRKTAGNIYRLENIIQEQVEPSLQGIASVLAGARRGLAAFIDTWRRGR